MTQKADVQNFDAGTVFETARRTITDTDIISFAGLSGDFDPLHVDDLFAAEASPFGRRIAHGQLIASIVTGLRSPLDHWPVMSYLGATRKFVAPVAGGDTIHCRYEVESNRVSKSNPKHTVVVLLVNVLNQHGETVMSGKDTMLLEPASDHSPDESAIYLEDIKLGHIFTTSRRTVYESDINIFSSISGDRSPLHTDLTFIRGSTGFKDKLLQGWLVLGIQSGLQSELKRWKILAYLEADRRFRAPAYPGDTLEARYIVEEIRPSRSKPDRGVVKLKCEVLNQDGDIVQEGYEAFMIASRTFGDR